MKALTITNPKITREDLLEMAKTIPGAWHGIRIAALLLLLSGYSSTKVASLLGLTRWGVLQWLHRANKVGLICVYRKNHKKQKKRKPSRLVNTPLHDHDLSLAANMVPASDTEPTCKKLLVQIV